MGLQHWPTLIARYFTIDATTGDITGVVGDGLVATAEKEDTNGVAALDGSGLIIATQIPFGTGASQVAEGAAVATSLALKAPLASPTLTGTPAGPTAAVGTNTTQLATTAFVNGQGSALEHGATAWRCFLPNNSTFQMVEDQAVFVYIGKVPVDCTPLYAAVHCSTAGAGAQTAEIGFFSTPAGPNKAAQTVTKLVATGSIGSLTGTGVIRNSSAFATSVAAGTHLWVGMRTAMASTEPILNGVNRDYEGGAVLYTATAGALTGTGPWTGALSGVPNTIAGFDCRVEFV